MRMHDSRAARGMVTAELALGVLAAAMLLVALCWGLAIAVLQVRCMDTAAQTARQAARGDHAAVARARADAPAGSEVRIRTVGDDVVVEVDLSARPIAKLPAVHLHARAETALEPGQEQPQ